MREILFRGKRVDSGEWVLGQVVIRPDHDDGCEKYFICETEHRFIRCLNKMPCTYEAIPETVGQYTGLKDKNGKRVFEGDILASRWDDSPHETIAGVVKYGNFNCSCCDGVYGWYCEGGDIRRLDDRIGWFDGEQLYLAGNIHDNPELIAEVQE